MIGKCDLRVELVGEKEEQTSWTYIHIATALNINVCGFNEGSMGTGTVRTGPNGGIEVRIERIKDPGDEGSLNVVESE